MKIAVIGAGAMGTIYGGLLSANNEVYLVDVNADVVDVINHKGLVIESGKESAVFHPKAVTGTEGIGTADLVLLFVKSAWSRSALEANTGIIGPGTRLMTLQNGMGHEAILADFVPRDHIIIGTTEDNGAVITPGHTKRGGNGVTNVGMLVPDTEKYLVNLKDNFDRCGFVVTIHENIQRLIWDKLFVNVSLSALTGILQVDMGFIAANPFAWNMAKQLVREAVVVAGKLGLGFDETELIERVRSVSVNNPYGCTSIRADLRDGRKTEVDTITGAVVAAANRVGVGVPSHEFVLNMVHAMEAVGGRS